MTYQTKKTDYGTKIGKIVDIFLHKCKYTDQEWIGYGAGLLQTQISAGYTGSVTLSGTQATKFNEPNVWLIIKNDLPSTETEYIKCTIVDDTTLTITERGSFGTTPGAHGLNSSVKIAHSGEVDGTCYGLTDCSAVNSYLQDLNIRFRFPSANLDFGEKYYHGLQGESPVSPTVKPSESMGGRGSTSVTIKDGKESDSYVPYSNHRTDNGTLFTKLMARNPYFEGRRMVVYEGFQSASLDLNDYQKREYLIDDLQMDDGIVSIKGLDPLILTEDKKAKAPLATPITLATPIDNSSTFFDYVEAIDFFFGPATTQFYVRIDSEVIHCEVLSEQRITILGRAIGGTEEKGHDIAATVQYVLHYSKVNVVTIIDDLIRSYTKIPVEFIDDYTSVIAATSTITLSTFITKPTEVKKLIDELLQVGLLTMWFSPTESKIKIARSADPNIEPINLDEESNIGIRSFKDKRLPDQQVTRFAIAFGPNDITKDSGEENFSVIYNPISGDVEADDKKGEVNERKTFFCRWLLNDADDAIIAFSVANDWVSKNSRMPTQVQVDIDAKDVGLTESGNLDLASVVNITTTERVSPDGSPLSDNYQVVSLKPKKNMLYTLIANLYQQPIAGGDVDLAITENQLNYVLSDHLIVGDIREYSVLIDTGVYIGSNDVNVAAFDTGTLPAGVTIKLIVRGSIRGMGGNGGNGGVAIATSPFDQQQEVYSSGNVGSDGGIALNVTVPISIDAGGGAIYAGGGGAAGRYSFASSIFNQSASYPGDGGSGGQGYGSSTGGNRGFATIDGFPTFDKYGLDGNPGNNAAPGLLAGVYGGRYGNHGDDDSYRNQNGILITVKGGLPGVAIRKNGNSVTITSGATDPDGNIRGRIEE